MVPLSNKHETFSAKTDIGEGQAIEMVRSVRQFESGATRDQDSDKLDYEGFLSPLVLREYAVYMHRHRKQSDGAMRASDNWMKGIPLDAYMKSGFRHFMDWWQCHRSPYGANPQVLMESLCALMFNIQGYLYEYLRQTSTPSTKTTEEIFGPSDEKS